MIPGSIRRPRLVRFSYPKPIRFRPKPQVSELQKALKNNKIRAAKRRPSLSASNCNDFKRIAVSGVLPISGTERTGTNPSGAVQMHAGCMQKTSEGIPNALFRAWPNVPEHIRLAILALIEPYCDHE